MYNTGIGRGRGSWTSRNDVPVFQERRPGPSGCGRGRGLFVPQRYNQCVQFQHSERRIDMIGRGRGRGLFVPQRYNECVQFQHSERRIDMIGRGIRDISLQPQRIVGETCNIGRGWGRGLFVPQRNNQDLQFQHSERRSDIKGCGIRSDSLPPQRLVGKTCNIGGKKDSVERETSGQDFPRKKELEKSDQEQLFTKFTANLLEHKGPAKFPFEEKHSYPLINENNRIPLLVNYFKLSLKNGVAYHYNIDILDTTDDNEMEKSRIFQGRTFKEEVQLEVKHVENQKRQNIDKEACRQAIAESLNLMDAVEQCYPIYDGGKNLFTNIPLPCKNGIQFFVKLCMEGKEKRFCGIISPVEKHDKTNIINIEPFKALYNKSYEKIPHEVLLVFETVMKKREFLTKPLNFSNNLFDLQVRNYSNLGCVLGIWKGYHQDVQLTEKGPVLVMNLADIALHKAISLIVFACDILNNDITRLPMLNDIQIKNLTVVLKGVQVKVADPRYPQIFEIQSLTLFTAKDTTLKVDGREISAVQGFLEWYQVKLNYPQLPFLQMSCGTLVPMEICVIVEGKSNAGKLSANLTSEMRKNALLEASTEVNNMSKDFMHSYGLFVDISLMEVDGRILTAPQLLYDKSRIAKPDERGVWRVEKGMKFIESVTIKNWVLISFADEIRFGREVYDKFCHSLVRSARNLGIKIDRPHSIDIYNGDNVSTERCLQKAKHSGAQMAVVVLNKSNFQHTSEEVNFFADFKFHIVTQCIEDKTVELIDNKIALSINQKMNVNLGGVNHIIHQRLQIFERPVILLGIDAIHWNRGYGYPSIISVVGSMNSTATRYALTCDLQKRAREGKISQEIIRNMRGVSKVVLNKFRKANGIDPSKIVVFRAGVSEGQFKHALDYEVSGLQEACKDLYQRHLPITYIVVQKRNGTKFFPARPSDGIGRLQNVRLGTCVDREVTHRVYFDYFILSHDNTQGASNPTKYTILHDDNKLPSEQLQQLCYFLCYTYFRCNRSVSLPAPVMYADLAATRAKKYADYRLRSMPYKFKKPFSHGIDRNLPPDVEMAIKSMQSFENPMFYV